MTYDKAVAKRLLERVKANKDLVILNENLESTRKTIEVGLETFGDADEEKFYRSLVNLEDELELIEALKLTERLEKLVAAHKARAPKTRPATAADLASGMKQQIATVTQ